jgi:hypothetical protein
VQGFLPLDLWQIPWPIESVQALHQEKGGESEDVIVLFDFLTT